MEQPPDHAPEGHDASIEGLEFDAVVDEWGDLDDDSPFRPPRWVLPTLVAPILALIAANNIGAILLTKSLRPSGLVDGPLPILALNATNKVLLAVGNQVPLTWFVLVATLRLLAPDGFFYGLGLLYRHQALRWGRRVFPGSDRLFDLFEREDHVGVRRLLDALIVIMPNNPVCLLAGIAAMPVRRFWTLNVIGTIGRVLLFFWLSHVFRDEIRSVMNFVASYQKWALLITVVAVVITLFSQAKRVVGATESLADGE